MSDERKDGGPAFPSRDKIEASRNDARQMSGADGMSLRDYFAGQVINGLAECFGYARGDTEPESVEKERWAKRAREAYAQADAMLAERERSR